MSQMIGSVTIRFSETKAVPFYFKSPLGVPITVGDGIVEVVDQDTGQVVFTDKPTSSIDYPTPSTGRVLFNLQPENYKLDPGPNGSGKTYIAICTCPVTAGSYSSPGLENLCFVTVTSDTFAG